MSLTHFGIYIYFFFTLPCPPFYSHCYYFWCSHVSEVTHSVTYYFCICLHFCSTLCAIKVSPPLAVPRSKIRRSRLISPVSTEVKSDYKLQSDYNCQSYSVQNPVQITVHGPVHSPVQSRVQLLQRPVWSLACIRVVPRTEC